MQLQARTDNRNQKLHLEAGLPSKLPASFIDEPLIRQDVDALQLVSLTGGIVIGIVSRGYFDSARAKGHVHQLCISDDGNAALVYRVQDVLAMMCCVPAAEAVGSFSLAAADCVVGAACRKMASLRGGFPVFSQQGREHCLVWAWSATQGSDFLYHARLNRKCAQHSTAQRWQAGGWRSTKGRRQCAASPPEVAHMLCYDKYSMLGLSMTQVSQPGSSQCACQEYMSAV